MMETPDLWLASTTVGAHARRAYGIEIGRLKDFLAQRGLTWGDISAARVRMFRRALLRGDFHAAKDGPAAGSLQQTRRIVSAFLRWGVATGRFPTAVLLELERWRGDASSAATFRATLPLRPLPSNALTRVRSLDAAAAALCFWAGASPAELAVLPSGALDAERGTLTLMRGGAAETIHLPATLARDLLRLRRKGASFFGGANAPKATDVARRISRWLKECDDTPLRTARELRSQFVARARDAGWSLEETRAQVRRRHLQGVPAAPPSRSRLKAIEAKTS